MIGEDVLYLSVSELSRLIKRKKLSPLRLAESYLSRIDRLNPKLRAFVNVTEDVAIRQARQSEKEQQAGLFRGPLHGIPYAVKDLFAFPGYPTTWGAKPFQNQTFEKKATVIQKLEAAGAVLIGKCSMSELAGGPPNATATGACRTPWDLERWSGGSSSGSGAAVGAGLVPFALGTETWGSIMTPASFCGVSGLRPTFGRISRSGAMALSWSMDKVGILSRTAADCATIFDVLQGPDPDDEATVKMPFKVILTKARERLAGLHIGFVQEDYVRWGSREVQGAFKQAVEIFKSLGARLEEVQLPAYDYEAIASTIIASEEAAAFEPLVRDGKIDEIIDPDRRGEILGGQLITAVDYLRCQRLRNKMATDFMELFQKYDLLLGSSTLQTAPLVTATMNEIFPGGNSLEAAENLLGLPGISIPCGFDSSKLPIGFKIIGRTFAESDIIEAAHAYQRVTRWHEKVPPL